MNKFNKIKSSRITKTLVIKINNHFKDIILKKIVTLLIIFIQKIINLKDSALKAYVLYYF